MEEKGRLLYEEVMRERRAQAELNPNHIGIFVSFLFLVLTWTVYGAMIWYGISTLWTVIGFILSLILSAIFIQIMGVLIREEFTQVIPIKVYDKGVLMPTTNFDRIIKRKQPFIHDNDLESVILIRTHKPSQKDILVATTKQGRTYIKKYDCNSEEPENILESVRISAPQAKVSIVE